MCMLLYYTSCKGPVCSKSHDCLRVPLFFQSSQVQHHLLAIVNVLWPRYVTEHGLRHSEKNVLCLRLCRAAIRWIVAQIILVFSFINSALTTLHPLVSVIRRMMMWLCQILKKNARCSNNKYVDSDPSQREKHFRNVLRAGSEHVFSKKGWKCFPLNDFLFYLFI